MLEHVNREILDLNEKILSNFEKLCDEVYIYRSMLTKKECEELIMKAKSNKTADSFFDGEKQVGGKYMIPELNKCKYMFSDLLNYENQNSISKDLYMSSNNWDSCLLQINSGGNSVHVDVYEYIDTTLRNASIRKNELKDKEVILPFASTLIYLSEDFDGGEICYPEYNLSYKPKAGDLLVHNSAIIHSVNPTTNGERWMHQNAFSAKFFVTDEDYENFSNNQLLLKDESTDYNNSSIDKGIHEKNKNEAFYYRLEQSPVKHKRLISYAEKNNIDLKTYGKII